MRLVFLGAPGVGKGTQAEMASARLAISKISTGDVLRDGVAKKTSLGLEAKQYMDQGTLVPDDVVIRLVEEKITSSECEKGFILDGFPRTVLQADSLLQILQKHRWNLDRVMYFVLPRDEVIRRLSGRRSCSKCPAVYHVDYVPPRRDGVCDECEAVLVQRSDDKKETVESRLRVYEEQTSPLIAYYKEKRLLAELDGTGRVEKVQERLLALLPGA